LRRRFLNDLTLFLNFWNYIPFEQGQTLSFSNYELSFPHDDMYKVLSPDLAFATYDLFTKTTRTFLSQLAGGGEGEGRSQANQTFYEIA
jgi:hypothetical protein